MSDDELFGPRRSIRLPGYPYAGEGVYFLTICAYRKRCLFGTIQDGAMELSKLGQIVAKCWEAIPKHFPHAELPAQVVMPNHLHGIVVLHPGNRQDKGRAEAFQKPVAGSIPTLVRTFKAAVTVAAGRSSVAPTHAVWQPNYFERVLRNGKEYTDAARYIAENPLRWQFDQENPEVQEPTRGARR
jgi:putative transposase